VCLILLAAIIRVHPLFPFIRSTCAYTLGLQGMFELTKLSE
jgi:hypothetical protein